jgi:tetratricopeptide (TPR) repeat protein
MNSLTEPKWLFIVIFVILFSSACSTSPSKMQAQIEELQHILSIDDPKVTQTPDNRKKMESLRSLYQEYLRTFPPDSVSSVYVYNLAMMEADYFKRYTESVKYLEQFYREFPTHTNAPKALFLLGYTYAEYVKDYERAKLVYEQFIQKYPDHELVPSIQFEIENLGKSPEELLNSKLTDEK